jgi:F-type H+-transporting ATPase subunit delta
MLAIEKNDTVSGKQLDALIGFFDTISRAMGANKTIAHFFNHPAISRDEKTRVMDKVFGKAVPESFSRLIDYLVNLRLVSYLPAIAGQFRAIRDARNGIKKVVVKSAVSLSGEEKKLLTKKISGLFSKELTPVFKVQPDLIAGFSVMVDSVVIENSLSSELQAFVAELKDQ